jgi:hypothetical protein
VLLSKKGIASPAFFQDEERGKQRKKYLKYQDLGFNLKLEKKITEIEDEVMLQKMP